MNNQKLLVFLRSVSSDFILSDYAIEIERAVRNASCNLLMRHHIEVPYDAIEFTDQWTVIVPVFLPDGMTRDDFNAGKRLSGISRFLLKYVPKTKEYVKGNRLFYYQVLKKEGE